jgi:hypothetical protein
VWALVFTRQIDDGLLASEAGSVSFRSRREGLNGQFIKVVEADFGRSEGRELTKVLFVIKDFDSHPCAETEVCLQAPRLSYLRAERFFRLACLFFFYIYPGGLPVKCPMTRCRPGRSLGDKHGSVWGDHAYPCIQLLPTHAELSPVFKVGVSAAHGSELITSPFICPL